MRALIQRVAFARVLVEEKMVGEIGNGMLVLLGVGADDHESDADYLSLKISKMRIFNDESGKMNESRSRIHGPMSSSTQELDNDTRNLYSTRSIQLRSS